MATKEEQLIKVAEKKEVIQFKRPNMNFVKKSKPKILTEDKYIEELSKIIQRDFFPHLEKLRAQNDYLNAMERRDYTQMEAIRAKYTDYQPTERAGSMSPATFETPIISHNATPLIDTASRRRLDDDQISNAESKKSISDKHSLDSFLEAYTSEDNNSFQEIIDTADRKLKEKFSILYGQEKLSADRLAKSLELPSIQRQFNEIDTGRKIETWNYTNKNAIMYIPDGVELTENEYFKQLQRKHSIKHNATRLETDPFATFNDNKLNKNDVNQIYVEKVGVDGKISGVETVTPQICGFSLMKTPSPRPGEAFSPLMTWGEIEGTPFKLDGSDTPLPTASGPSFRIKENSRRESIALSLAEKAGEKMRSQKQQSLETARKSIKSPFLRSNMERLASMSPAARHLATSKLGVGLQSPIVTPLSTPFIKSKSKYNTPILSTPKRNEIITKTSTTTTAAIIDANKSTLTDDLLKIPTKRFKAADFF